MNAQHATFAAGCFWGIEEAFRQVEGVIATAVGYTGGTRVDPTYKDVCSGGTGHAEAVEVEYDADQVSYQALLETFWAVHDPTTLNRQGPDIGTQYRSAIFYHNPEQAAQAKASLEKQQQAIGRDKAIVTQITPASTFYPAEQYHQQYLAKGGRGACASTVQR